MRLHFVNEGVQECATTDHIYRERRILVPGHSGSRVGKLDGKSPHRAKMMEAGKLQVPTQGREVHIQQALCELITLLEGCLQKHRQCLGFQLEKELAKKRPQMRPNMRPNENIE